MPLQLPAPAALSRLSADELEAVLAPLFESGSTIARRLVGMEFSSWDGVLAAAAAVIAGMSIDEQIALLSGHARLGEDPGRLNALSRVSFHEQQGASPSAAAAPSAADGVRRSLLALGHQYEERFGFPFVEFVAGRPLADIVPVLQRRMANGREVELATALRAVVDIAADRAARSTVVDVHGGETAEPVKEESP